jgi:Flp pilus assembly protein TadG
MRRIRWTRGQATVELIAVLPVLVIALLATVEGVLGAWAALAATDAATIGVRAGAIGGDAGRTARAALPAALRRGSTVRVADGRVRVSVRVPPLVPWPAWRIAGDAG